MSSKLMVGFLAGAAIGALAGILFAPDKGSNTRKKIATKTGDITDSVKSSFSDFIDGVKETYSGVKESYSGVKENAEDFVSKAKSAVSKNDGKSAFS